MDTRLKKLMCLLAVLAMMILPVAGIGIVEEAHADDTGASGNVCVSPDASRYKYLLLHDGLAVNDNNPLVYVGDAVDLSGFTCVELDTDNLVCPGYIEYKLEGPVVDGVYVAAGAVTVSVVEINSNLVLCAGIFTVQPNVLAVTEHVAELTYTADVIDPKEFITAVTLNGQAYTDYDVKCVSAEEIKNVGAYVLEVSSNNAALKAEPVQVNVEVVKATPEVDVEFDYLPYTGEEMDAEDFGLTIKVGEKDVSGECTITYSPDKILEAGEYSIHVAGGNNLEDAEKTVKVWAALDIAEPSNNIYDKVYVINGDNCSIKVSGEPQQWVNVYVNGAEKPELKQLNADGNATIELTAINEGSFADRKQTIRVSYQEFEEIEDNVSVYLDAIISDALNVEVPHNRQEQLEVVLPEPGYVSKIEVKWTSEITDILYTDDKVKDQYSEVSIPLEYAYLINQPAGATYSVYFKDLAGNEYEAVSVVTTLYSSKPGISIQPAKNTKDRVKGGDLEVTVTGLIGETVIVSNSWNSDVREITISGDEGSREGKATVTFPQSDIPRNQVLSVTAEYVNIDGSNSIGGFQYDDYCSKPIILTPVYENAYVIAGVVEVGSAVEISYPDYPELGSTFVRPDAYGFFAAELDMLDEGDKVQIEVQDLGDNWTSVVLVAQAEDELATQMAYPMGKLFTNNRVTDQPWLVATKVKIDDLKDGVTLPILANNCFEIGEFTAVMDENGNVVYNYTVDDSVAVVVDSYMTFAKKFDYEAFAGRWSTAVEAGEAFAIDANAKEIWIYAEFAVELDVDAMVETFQLQSVRDNEVKQEYTKLQRN